MLSIRPTLLASVVAAVVSLAAVAPAALAGPPVKTPKKSAPAATQYECQKCHMRYSAAVAKKDKFIDPMDGGKLTPVKATAKKAPAAKSNKPKP